MLSSVSNPEDELGPAGIDSPIHSLSIPTTLLMNSFAAFKNTWLHTITPRTTEKKGYPHHTFSSNLACFHMPPSHTRLPGEGNTSQMLALPMLTSCSHAGFQQMEGGGVAITTEGLGKRRRCKGRHVGDWLMVRKDWALVWHHLAMSCQDYLTRSPKRCTFIEGPPNPNRCTRLSNI